MGFWVRDWVNGMVLVCFVYRHFSTHIYPAVVYCSFKFWLHVHVFAYWVTSWLLGIDLARILPRV